MTSSFPRHPLWLDRALGNPMRDPGPFGFQASVELDEREEFPSQAAGLLDDLGVCRHFVPVGTGGELRSFEELALLLRAVARRDVTLAVGHRPRPASVHNRHSSPAMTRASATSRPASSRESPSRWD